MSVAGWIQCIEKFINKWDRTKITVVKPISVGDRSTALKDVGPRFFTFHAIEQGIVAQIRRHHWVWFCKAGAIQLSIK
jgi:hypothetical protein